MRNTYFLEKSSVLIRKLIAGEGTSKQRLRECEMQIFLVLAIPVSSDLESLREKILKDLTKKNAIGGITAFRNTLIFMKNKVASKIISDIYELHSEILFRRNF